MPFITVGVILAWTMLKSVPITANFKQQMDIFGNLDKTRVLLLGAGDIGEKTAKAFRSRGAGSLVVASRRMERAMELASELNATAMPFGQHEAHLSQFDIVVGSTASGFFSRITRSASFPTSSVPFAFSSLS